MSRQHLIILSILGLAVASCGQTGSGHHVDGSLDGIVYMTASVGGVVVTAYSYDQTSGQRGAEIAHSDPTDVQGHFHLDTGIYFGPMMLVARGVSATYAEPATGATANWDAALELRALWVTRTSTEDLTFDFERGAAEKDFVISPWTELSIAHGDAMKMARNTTFTDSIRQSLLLFHDHMELDFWNQVPADLTTDTSPNWGPDVQAGLEYAGLSELVKRIGDDSHTGGLTTIDLLQLLIRDAADGVFDGKDLNDNLSLGSCPRECKLSSHTLRSDLADSMATFLQASHSKLAASAINDFLVRLSMRHAELFPADAVDSYDVTPPTITVVESTVNDESGVKASVLYNPPIPTYSGTVRAVPLNADTTAKFSRYASHYGPSDSGIPRWHFLVMDDRTDPVHILVEARLSRVEKDQAIELVPWQTVPPIDGSGYNREIVVSSALHNDIALISGTYRIDVRATDEKGNVSSTSVEWQQTILTPPLRQQTAPACDPCYDLQCPEHYTLDNLSLQNAACGGGNNADVAITGRGLPGGMLRIAHGVIENPNPVPVRARLSVQAPMFYEYGIEWKQLTPAAFHFAHGCERAKSAERDDGSCYSPPQYGVEDTEDKLSSLQTQFRTYLAGAELGPCPTCMSDEREIPANSTVDVWIYSPPFSFIGSSSVVPIPDTPNPLTGIVGARWVDCVINWESGACPEQQASYVRYHQDIEWLTRILVSPQVQVSLQARPDDNRMPLGSPTGTDVISFDYTPSKWATQETGQAGF